MTLRHRIAHALGWYTGRVETFWALFRHGDDKRLMVGFRCDTCGDINHVHEAPRWMWNGVPTGLPGITPRDAQLVERIGNEAAEQFLRQFVRDSPENAPEIQGATPRGEAR